MTKRTCLLGVTLVSFSIAATGCGGGGDSGGGADDDASLDGDDGHAPTFAGAKSIEQVAPDSVLIKWDAATDPVTPSSKIVYRATQSAPPKGVVRTTASGALATTIDGLAPGTYSFIVNAVNELGVQDPNTKVVTITLGAGDTGIDSGTDGGADTATADSATDDTLTADTLVADSPSDGGVDSTVADTTVTDTFVDDTTPADTFVPDTFVPDTFVPDTALPDTFVPPPTGCSSSVTVGESYSSGMYGCAGAVTWASRGTLCGAGYRSCTAADWIARRGSKVPAHDYWTSDQLKYSGTAAACSVSLATGTTCGTGDRPMRVCGAATDPEGNTCTWTNCGDESTTPDEYFGGCAANPTAGALCCTGTPGCAAGVTMSESFSTGMYGCAGSVPWASRDSLCAVGYHSCTAAEWVSGRAGAAPTHNYWTNDQLLYSGTGPGACWVSSTTGSTCGTGDRPMRVCGATTDAEGNTCTWTNCGEGAATPNQYFGGCVSNPTAGSLCCPGGAVPVDTTPPTFTGSPTVSPVYADTVASSGQLKVTWADATDAVSPASDIRYEICWGACAPFTAMFITGYGANTYTISGLTSNQTYNVYVRAQDFAGNTETGTHTDSAKTAMSYSTFIDTGVFNATPASGGCNGGCHSPLWDYSNTVGPGGTGVAACGGKLINPGAASSSIIWEKMNGSANPCGGGQMPASPGVPNATKIGHMQTWINEGAHNN